MILRFFSNLNDSMAHKNWEQSPKAVRYMASEGLSLGDISSLSLIPSPSPTSAHAPKIPTQSPPRTGPTDDHRHAKYNLCLQAGTPSPLQTSSTIPSSILHPNRNRFSNSHSVTDTPRHFRKKVLFTAFMQRATFHFLQGNRNCSVARKVGISSSERSPAFALPHVQALFKPCIPLLDPGCSPAPPAHHTASPRPAQPVHRLATSSQKHCKRRQRRPASAETDGICPRKLLIQHSRGCFYFIRAHPCSTVPCSAACERQVASFFKREKRTGFICRNKLQPGNNVCS